MLLAAPRALILRDALRRLGARLGPAAGRLAFAAEVEGAVAAAFAKMDAALRKALNIGAVKADVPEVPATGPAEAKEAIRGRKG